MNIKNRLKKMETQTVKADFEFCGCYEKHWKSAVESAYHDTSDLEIEVSPSPDFEKGFCDKCKKPFSIKDVEMSRSFEEIYGNKQL